MGSVWADVYNTAIIREMTSNYTCPIHMSYTHVLHICSRFNHVDDVVEDINVLSHCESPRNLCPIYILYLARRRLVRLCVLRLAPNTCPINYACCYARWSLPDWSFWLAKGDSGASDWLEMIQELLIGREVIRGACHLLGAKSHIILCSISRWGPRAKLHW